MEEKKYYPEIRIRLLIKEDDVLSRNEDGTTNFSDDFLYRMNKKKEEFAVQIEDKIRQLNSENIVILFEEFSKGERDFYNVYINGKDVNLELRIKGIIETSITYINMDFHYSNFR